MKPKGTKMNSGENALEFALLITLDNLSTGSGFRLNAGKKLFIITAKHVLFDSHGNLRAQTAEISCTNKTENESTNKGHRLKISFKKNKPLVHKTADVCAIHIGNINKMSNGLSNVQYLKKIEILNKGDGDVIAANYYEVQLLKDVIVSNDVFLIGYPTSLGLKHSPQFDYNQPLLRKGIVANIYKEKGTIILDCPAYYGNSGGPVLQVNGNQSPLVVGVVSNFIPFVQGWINTREKDLVHQEYLNSGYSVAVSMDKVFELIGFDPDTPKNTP